MNDRFRVSLPFRHSLLWLTFQFSGNPPEMSATTACHLSINGGGPVVPWKQSRESVYSRIPRGNGHNFYQR
jgi:hypothetical protein